MSISLDDLKKLELNGTEALQSVSPDEVLTAVFKVKESGYVPPKVQLRARIDSEMFTGRLLAGDLREIESDEKVVSVALSQPLKLIK